MFTLIIQLFEGIFKLIFELLSLVFTTFSKKKGYHADFATEGILLSRRYKGFCLTGRKNISVKDSYMNCLVQGQTGSGKTQATLLPGLFSMDGSFVVHDPAKEIWNSSSGYLASKGYEVKVLNFTDPSVSCGFNPMSRANTSSEIQKLAAMLVRTSLSGGGKEDPFWTSQATALIAILISILKTQPQEYQNLYNVRRLLNEMGTKPKDEDEMNPVDVLFQKYADEILYNEYKSFIGYETKLLTSIIATCKSALTIFSDESVAKVTANDSIDFMELRKKPVVIYLQNSISDQKYYSVLVAIFFEQLTNFILSRFPEKEEQDIFMLIDEFSSLKVPVFPIAFANVRKHRAGIMAVVQDFNQIIGAYGKQDAEAIRANCYSKLFFTGASLETSKELEQTLGKFEYKDDEGKKQIRPLMTNDEIRTMEPNRALLISGHHAPIRVRLRPCYQNRRYRQFCAFKPAIQKGESADFLAMLPLEQPDPTDA